MADAAQKGSGFRWLANLGFVVGVLVLGAMWLNTPKAPEFDASGHLVNEPEISAAEFAQLRPGMTHAQAAAIIGSPGKLESETVTAGLRSRIYSWEGLTAFGSATIMFDNDRLTAMTQNGLR